MNGNDRGVKEMDGSKFNMLLDVLRILEKHEDPNVVESALEIIDSFNGGLTQDQKAELLKEVLHFKGSSYSEERERKFQDEWRKEQMRESFMHDFY
jgi:hypothetical protein